MDSPKFMSISSSHPLVHKMLLCSEERTVGSTNFSTITSELVSIVKSTVSSIVEALQFVHECPGWHSIVQGTFCFLQKQLLLLWHRVRQRHDVEGSTCAEVLERGTSLCGDDVVDDADGS